MFYVRDLLSDPYLALSSVSVYFQAKISINIALFLVLCNKLCYET